MSNNNDNNIKDGDRVWFIKYANRGIPFVKADIVIGIGDDFVFLDALADTVDKSDLFTTKDAALQELKKRLDKSVDNDSKQLNALSGRIKSTKNLSKFVNKQTKIVETRRKKKQQRLHYINFALKNKK